MSDNSSSQKPPKISPGALYSHYVTESKSPALVKLLLIIMLFNGICFVTGSYFYILRYGPQKSPVVELHQDSGEEPGSGKSTVLLGKTLPDSITRRQDGVMEADHDLVDPDIQSVRSIASTLKEQDLKVARTIRYVEIFDIFAGVNSGLRKQSTLMLNVAFEVKSFETMKEIQGQEIQIRALISSMISERQRETLRDFRGVSSLKSDIQGELNRRLKSGVITDVLFTRFVMQ